MGSLYKLKAPGVFEELGGHRVQTHLLPDNIMEHATTYALGEPHQLTFHYQAGCGADISSGMIARGYPTAQFSVDQDGGWHQYYNARIAGWHLYDESRYSIGVEHAADDPGGGGCDLNDDQLQASADGHAGLIQWVEAFSGFVIPLRHAENCGTYKTNAGLNEHDDFLPCRTLNPHRHTDHLYGWGWDKWLYEIGSKLGSAPEGPPDFPGELLKLGTEHASVIRWKKRMRALGFAVPNTSPHFGPRIEHLTRRFQDSHDLAVDGIVGPMTWKKAWQVQIDHA